MKKLISSVLLAVIAAVSAVLFSIGVTLAQSAPDVSSGPRLAGIANCPTGTLEAFLIPYARGGGPCETVLTCLNTSTKDGGFTGQFFFGFGNTQAGSDASIILLAGEADEAATASTDPLSIFIINADAATGAFEGKARICAASGTKVACHAHLVCTGGLERLNVINKSQKGD